MRVFVTGGAGYIGSVCVEALLNAGHSVIVYDNLSEGHRAAVDSRAEFVEGDLANGAFLSSTMQRVRPDAVMHFASNTLVGVSMTHPGKYLRDNVANAVNLFEACVATGVKNFVFSSTCAIFGLPAVVPITEDLPKEPINPYGESKLAVERALAWYGKLFGLRYVCLRYFNAAGATEKFGEHHVEETHLIPNILKVALNHSPNATIFGADYPTPDGTCIRDYIHVLDLAEAHILALGVERSDVFNLGSGTGYSVREVVETIRRVTGHAIPVTISPRRPGDPPRLVADSTKIRTRLKWVPRRDNLETILRDAWRWHQAHPHGYRSL